MPAKIAVVIPARYGSTRFPGKPLHPIAGKPLLQHVWERCGKARGIHRVIVATDDMRIAEAAFAFGAEVSLTNPSHLSGTDRCAEVAARLRGFSHVINVQGDEPLIDPALIGRLAKALRADKHLAMITAASEFGAGEDVGNPNAVKVVLDREKNALYFSRSVIPFVRDRGGVAAKERKERKEGGSPTAASLCSFAAEKPAFLRHHGIYGYSTKFLLEFVRWKSGVLEQIEQLEQLRALEGGAKIRVLLTKTASVGVDSPEDVAVVEARLSIVPTAPRTSRKASNLNSQVSTSP